MRASGQYTAQDGQTKTNWVKVGMLGVSQNGKEYILLDPTINLAGFTREAGKDMLMCSVFEDQPKQQTQQSQYQQAPQGQTINQNPQQQAYQQQAQPQQNQQGAMNQVQFDADGNQIPFAPLKVT